MLLSDIRGREVRPAKRARKGEWGCALRAEARGWCTGRARLVGAQVLAQIGLAPELFVAIRAHEDLGCRPRAGTAWPGTAAPEHHLGVGGLRSCCLWVHQRLQACESGAVPVLTGPGAVPGLRVLIVGPRHAAVLLARRQGRVRRGQRRGGRFTRGAGGRGTWLVPAAMGGEVRGAAEDLVALGAAVLDAHDAGAAVLSQREGVRVLLLAQLADELPQRRADAAQSPRRRPGLLLLDLQTEHRGRGHLVCEAQPPHRLRLPDGHGRRRHAAQGALAAALETLRGGRGRGDGDGDGDPRRHQLLPRGRGRGRRGAEGGGAGEGLGGDGRAQAALQERAAQLGARRPRGAGSRAVSATRAPLGAVPRGREAGGPRQSPAGLVGRGWCSSAGTRRREKRFGRARAVGAARALGSLHQEAPRHGGSGARASPGARRAGPGRACGYRLYS